MSNLTNPPKDCALCPRLADFRDENQRKYPDWFNGPVPPWGDNAAKLIIVGLAPGLQGANRTGRPFTGDYAGDLLFQTLGRAGLSTGTYQARVDDGLELHGVLIVNAVRCLLSQNKPTGPEIKACRQYLTATLEKNSQAQVYLALGRIAHESFLSTIGVRRAAYPFAHGARHEFDDGRLLYDSYHCSRYNTNTKRLTEEMFENVVFAATKEALGQS